MKFSVEDRADRLMRRDFGFVRRDSFTWANFRLGVAFRDLKRAVLEAVTADLSRLRRIIGA